MKDFLSDSEMAQLEKGVISDERLSMRENIASDQAKYNKEASKSTGRRFLSALPSETASTLLKNPIKFATSAVAAPVDIVRGAMGKQPMQGSLPFVGRTFQGDASKSMEGLYDKAYDGNLGRFEQLKALEPFAQVPLAGIEAATVPGLAKSAKTLGAQAVEKGATMLSNRAEKKALNYALELTERKVTNKVAEDAIKKGSAGFTEPTLFKRGKLVPTSQDNKVAESVAPYVDPKLSVQENIDRISEGVSQTNLGVRNMIADNKVPFNGKTLRANLNTAKEDSKLIFAGDNTAERAYDAVVDEFVKHVDGKDTLGLFDGRQSFDQMVKQKFPNAFKKDATGQFLDPRDNARVNAILDVRRAANEYIAEQLPVNNPYRAALKNESHMIDAIGRIAAKNTERLTKNKLQMLTEQYPIVKWIVGGLVGAGGVGVGGALINSTD